MSKLRLMCIIIVLVTVLLPGCALITGEEAGKTSAEEIPVTTEFGQMLELLPYSFVEEHDIWFGNPGKAKELHGLEDLDSNEAIEEAIKQLPEEQQRQFIADFVGAAVAFPAWNRPPVAPLVGFDIMAVDQLLCGNVMPPRGYFILEGDFDKALIGQKLTEQGYTKTDYGQYSYYGIRGDFEIDMRHPLSRLVLASLNRVAVLDDIIITSPVTADITGIFDAMAGDTPAAIDNAACRALADSLGDVLGATLTTPERIIFTDPSAQEQIPEFDFTLPDNWGILQGYEMAALGYRAEGEKHFFDIALYYEDEETAKADGREIVKRMSTHMLNSWDENTDDIAFTNWYQPGEPVVTPYAEGAVLKISCQVLSEERFGISMVMGGGAGWPFRDILFLAPDPSPYIGKNESTVVIIKETP